MDTDFGLKLQQLFDDALVDIALNCKSLQLFAAKLDALDEISERCKEYRELGFTPEIILTVLTKKLELLKQATTVRVTKKLKKPCAPTYHNNGEFETDDTWVAEEELIQWSLASLRAPLPQNAFKRYLDLFQQTFHMNISEL